MSVSRRWRRCAPAAALAAAFALADWLPAVAKPASKIAPGPTAISEEEKAIQPDPGRGAEHGIVLLQEIERNQDLAVLDQTAFHMRAKILSNEGRDLANVSIPIGDSRNELIEWWGRTLLPDGGVLELKREELADQPVVTTALRRSRVLKGALPGVVPGAVIDFGYVVRHRQDLEDFRLPIQLSWLVRELRYDWVPAQGRGTAYLIARAEQLDVKATKEGRTIRFTAKDVPPVANEPMMPPDDEIRASITTYYTMYGKDKKFFWPDAARNVEERLHAFLTKDQPVLAKTAALKNAIKEMEIPKDADLGTKVRLAYEWMKKNIENLEDRTSEEREVAAAGKNRDEWENSAMWVLDARKATFFQLDQLIVGFAREFGARAFIVYAADRTDHYFNPGLISYDQFDGTLAVIFTGEGDKEYTLCDPGWGLPYGEIPWWFSGSKGLLLTDEAAKAIMLWPSEAKSNVSESKATLEFSDDNATIKSVWSRSTTGQRWLLDRRILRRLQPEPRKNRLKEICGKVEDVEAERSEAPDLDKDNAPFRISCETSRPSLLDEEITDYKTVAAGAWIEYVPELIAPKRTHPVIFDFPRVDLVTIEVRSPKGFAPADAPAPVKREGRFGRYEFSVEKAAQGFIVHRKLALLALRVPPNEYQELRTFLQEVLRADRTWLPFKRLPGEGSSASAAPVRGGDPS